MIQDEIIRMARETGLHKMIQVTHVGVKVYKIPSENLVNFANLVFAAGAAHEREACAKVCEELQNDAVAKYFDATAGECAAAIRARGEK